MSNRVNDYIIENILDEATDIYFTRFATNEDEEAKDNWLEATFGKCDTVEDYRDVLNELKTHERN